MRSEKSGGDFARVRRNRYGRIVTRSKKGRRQRVFNSNASILGVEKKGQLNETHVSYRQQNNNSK